ncbi:hypothetical protein V6Z11_D11G237700 [Gossypium hirsutum]
MLSFTETNQKFDKKKGDFSDTHFRRDSKHQNCSIRSSKPIQEPSSLLIYQTPEKKTPLIINKNDKTKEAKNQKKLNIFFLGRIKIEKLQRTKIWGMTYIKHICL